jgi:hypothetical protein
VVNRAHTRWRRAFIDTDISLTDRMLDIVSLKLMLYAACVMMFMINYLWDAPWSCPELSPYLVALYPSCIMASLLAQAALSIVKRRLWAMIVALFLIVAADLAYLTSFTDLTRPFSKLFLYVVVPCLAVEISVLPLMKRVQTICCCFCFIVVIVLIGSRLYLSYIPLRVLPYTLVLFLTAATLAIALSRFTREVRDGRRSS